MMKKKALVGLIGVSIVLAGCGGSSAFSTTLADSSTCADWNHAWDADNSMPQDYESTVVQSRHLTAAADDALQGAIESACAGTPDSPPVDPSTSLGDVVAQYLQSVEANGEDPIQHDGGYDGLTPAQLNQTLTQTNGY